MRFGFLFVLILLFCSTHSNGQSRKDKKYIDKCWNIYFKKGQSSGIAKLRKYMDEQSISSFYAHESLVRMEYEKYVRAGGTLKKRDQTDSTNNALQTIYEGAMKSAFIDVCRRSTIESTSPSGDQYLHEMFIAYNPDTLVSSKSQSYFDEGREFYSTGDLEMAKMNFQKAINTDTHFYQAHIYLGSVYTSLELEDSAMITYLKAKSLQPKFLEPRIYVINHLINKGLYYRAKKECLDAMLLYPGFNMKYLFNRILKVENKYLNDHRITRNFYPNNKSNKDIYQGDFNAVWRTYKSAGEIALPFCDENGIIQPNDSVKEQYLEVYCYRKMLKTHQHDLPANLHFADKMNEEGFLEPYIFFSQFHFDIYPQFKHYIENAENQEKCKSYIEKYLITTKSTFN